MGVRCVGVIQAEYAMKMAKNDGISDDNAVGHQPFIMIYNRHYVMCNKH